MKWTPVIINSIHSDTEEKIHKIHNTIFNNYFLLNDSISLMDGLSSIILFFTYYSRFANIKVFRDYSIELLSKIVDNVNNGFIFPTLSAGLAGFGWTIEHLSKYNFIEIDTNNLLEELDDFLYMHMISEIKKGNYDYLHGALGSAIYFLSRLQMKKSKDYLIHFIAELEKIGIVNKDGSIKWKGIIHKGNEKIEVYNLGLSHGITSIIAFLIKAYKHDIEKEKVKYLLKSAVDYVLKHRLNIEKYTSYFPTVICDNDTTSSSRLAWCYGDLGISISLWQASQSLKVKEWETIAIDVLLYNTKRRNLEMNFVRDAGLCHGTAGIAHIFNRMYNYTDIEDFKEAAIYWVDQTLKMSIFNDGYAGYKTFRTPEYGGWTNSLGLLEGIAGIGLILISAISDIEPRWDECLLLS